MPIFTRVLLTMIYASWSSDQAFGRVGAFGAFGAYATLEPFAGGGVAAGTNAAADAASAGPSVFQRGLEAASALVRGALQVDGTFCVGTACVDTVAFGRALRASARSEALVVQTLASSVFTVNSMRGNSALLPSQSVLILTFVDGDYDALLSDPAATAAFAAAVKAAVASNKALPPGTELDVVSTLAAGDRGGNGGIDVSLLISYPTTLAAASASAATERLISTFRVPARSSDFSKLGIKGVVGTDATAAVGSHAALFASWGASEETRAAVDAASDRREFVKAKLGRS